MIVLSSSLIFFANGSFTSSPSAAPVAKDPIRFVKPGLEAAFWKGTFFGSPLPTWPTYQGETSPPAGTPSLTPPTVTEIDPNIAFDISTTSQWDESEQVWPVPVPPIPGNPGGFAVTEGGYGVDGVGTPYTEFSWGDPNLYTDYQGSTVFVNVEFSAEWTGYIYLSAYSTYYFQLESDDGSWLYINQIPGSSTISHLDLLIATPPDGDTRISPINPADISKSVTVPNSGWYPIEVDYYETQDGNSGIDLNWAMTTNPSDFSIIPAASFKPSLLGSNAWASVFAVKFVCNVWSGKQGSASAAQQLSLEPGFYDTDINIHNPSYMTSNVTFTEKFIVAMPQNIGLGSPPDEQQVSPVPSPYALRTITLEPDAAIRLDCSQILAYLAASSADQGTTVCGIPGDIPIHTPLYTCKGYVMIYTYVPMMTDDPDAAAANNLNVWVEYSATPSKTAGVSSLQVVQVQPTAYVP